MKALRHFKKSYTNKFASKFHNVRNAYQRWLLLSLKITIALLILWLLRDKLDGKQIDFALHQPWMVIITMMGWGINQLLTTLRLHAMLNALALPTSFNNLLKANFAALFLGNMMPGSTGADVVKFFYIKKHNNKIPNTHLVMVLGLDRFFGLLSILFWCSLFGCFMNVPGKEMALWTLTPLCLLIVLVSAFLLSGLFLKTFHRLDLHPILKNLIDIAVRLMHVRDKKLLFLMAAYNLLAMWVLIGSQVFVGVLLQIHQGHAPLFATQFFLIPLSLVIALLPLTPMGIGTTQAALAVVYPVFGIDPAVGITVSTMGQLGLLALSLTVGGWFFFKTRPGKAR